MLDDRYPWRESLQPVKGDAGGPRQPIAAIVEGFDRAQLGQPLMAASGPLTWTPNSMSKRWKSISAIPPRCEPLPALFTRQSSLPKVVTACAIIAATSDSTLTSVRMKLAAAPSVRANRFPFSSRRPVMTTRAPSATNRSAVRAPMPLVPARPCGECHSYRRSTINDCAERPK